MRPWSLALFAAACRPGPPAGGGGKSPADSASPADTGSDTGGPPGPALTVLHPVAGLGPAALAIVVNTDDPLSAGRAAAYAAAWGIPDDRIVPLPLGAGTTLSEADFAVQKAALDAALGPEVQALLLAFAAPFRVGCMGATAAFGLGFDPAYCQAGPPCLPTAESPLYRADTRQPVQDHGVRYAMMLAVPDAAAAEALAARGRASLATNPVGTAYLVGTNDAARNVRAPDYPVTAERFDPASFAVTVTDASAGDPESLAGATDVLGYLTGLTAVPGLDSLTFAPGALADHLTSYGGVLDGSGGQMPITDWLAAGATASYGTAHEPCNYPQKFPKASVLWPAYFRGATAVEAYWQSVQWPGEGNFVGDPLARPFAPEITVDGRAVTIRSSHLDRRRTYRIEGAASADGPWEVLQDGIEGGTTHRWHTLTVDAGPHAVVRLVEAP